MRRLVAVALVLLQSPAAATTYLVDVANGPGTDFTQITSAVAAASPGDTLLVMPGQYASFVLDKSLAIVGQGEPGNEARTPTMTVQSLPAGSTTAIASLDATQVVLINSPGAMLLDDVRADTVSVSFCADVRFRRLEVTGGMQCGNARVEVADSLLEGRDSIDTCTCCNWPHTPGPGGVGLSLSGGETHLSRTSVRGGTGGSISCADTGICDGFGGAGGTGIALSNGARLSLSGSGNSFVQGGPGGNSVCASGGNGLPGLALAFPPGTEVRISGMTLAGQVSGGGTWSSPDPADPTAFAIGPPAAGSLWTVRVAGPVGASVDVVLGRRPTLSPTPQLDLEPGCPVHRVFHLGAIPANGATSLNFPVPPSWPQGFSVVFQAVLTLPDSSVRYTNSLPAIVQ